MNESDNKQSDLFLFFLPINFIKVVRELVIHSNTIGVEIALLENKRLMEYHIDRFDQNGFSAGDIYLGRIKKINPGLNAAFVDIGHDKDAFIHYSDLSPSLLSLKKFTQSINSNTQDALLEDFELEDSIAKDGKIQDVLEKGDWVMTQIMKEAISTKGPRMTCEVTIPGRYVVLTPFANSVGISKKISDSSERQRLTEIIEKLKPKNFGIVVRTNTERLGEDEIQRDIDSLMKKWTKIKEGLVEPKSPRRLLSEMAKSFSLIRDMLNDTYERVICDNAKLFDSIRIYLEEKAPQYADKLELYRGLRPIFDEFDVNRQVKNSFGKNVTMKSGAYLVIEHTEALHVIDVNSGPKINTTADQDTNAFNVNCEAVLEIARQMRMRDIGGIIVVDFIDMKSSDYRNKVLQAMEEAMRSDRARHSLLPISRFGLMEITRQRVRSEISLETEATPKSLANLSDDPNAFIALIEKEIALLKSHDASGNQYNLSVHPYVAAYLRKGWIPKKWQWYLKEKSWIDIIEDSSLALNEFYIINKQRNTVD
ncbi:MAG: Rne/Rng family ribonuclease [Chitinophagales bacterium]|nr:Rne/Rng family ribonuclease [Chitinophagales bacterium]MCZ2392952.1 Rne/Rng family ribonuclease [Chitinophagales bacterium]